MVSSSALFGSNPEHVDSGYQLYLITCVIFLAHTERSRIVINRHQEVKMVMNIWAKIPGRERSFLPSSCFSSALFLHCCLRKRPLLNIQEAAATGNAQAQFAIANDYFRIRYTTLNYAEILTWKSAAQGFAPAQNQLGSMYDITSAPVVVRR